MRNNFLFAGWKRGCSPLNAWMVEPNRGLMLVNLGLTRDQLGQPDLAAESYRQAIGSDPGEASAYYYLGTFHQGREELEEAIGLYEQAIALRPNFTDAYLRLAGAQRDVGRVDEAIATLDALLRLVHGNLEALQMRQELIRIRGDG